MGQSVNIQISANFEHNLEAIRCYFHQHHADEKAYEQLLDRLFDIIIPNLQSHPMIGFDFLAQRADSVEAIRKVETITAMLPPETSIRQYNDRDYIVLYALRGFEVSLLAIKHQKQLGFDVENLV